MRCVAWASCSSTSEANFSAGAGFSRIASMVRLSILAKPTVATGGLAILTCHSKVVRRFREGLSLPVTCRYAAKAVPLALVPPESLTMPLGSGHDRADHRQRCVPLQDRSRTRQRGHGHRLPRHVLQ